MKTKIRLTLLALIIMPLLVSSQEEVVERQYRHQEKKKEIEAKKVAFITEKISLTPEEAQSFWPVYNEFQEKKQTHSRQNRMMQRNTEKNYDNMNDKELEKIADAEIERMLEMYNIRKEYHEKFKAILPIKKVVMFYDAEKEFKKVLLEDLRSERKHKRNEGRGRF